MAWLLFAILAPALFAIANLFDKVLTKNFSPFSLNVMTGVLSGLAIFALPFTGLNLPFFAIILAIIAGSFWFLGGFPYYKAIQIEEVSRVVPLWQLTVPMTLLFAILFLGEKLTAKSYVAVALIFLGAFLISAKSIRETLKITPAFWLMVLATALITASALLTKFLYGFGSFAHVQVLLLLGNFSASIIFLAFSKNSRRQMFREIKHNSMGQKYVFGARNVVEFSGYFALNVAILTGPISLTMLLDGLSGFFVFIAATVISIWQPSLFREELDRKTLLIKFAAILIIIAGLVLVSGVQ